MKKINEKETHMVMINQTDIKGLVPIWIVNMVAQKAPINWFKKLEKGIKLFQKQN